MKILHITPHYHPAVGGCETYTKEISERLAQRGHDVTVLAMAGHAERLPGSEIVGGVTVKRYRPAGRGNDVIRLCLRPLGRRTSTGLAMDATAVEMYSASPYGLRPFYSSLLSRSDVVSVINWYGGWLPYQVGLARRLREFSLVGIPLFHTERVWSQAAYYSTMLQHCDAIVALTAHEKEFIERQSPRTTSTRVGGAGVDPLFAASANGHRIRALYGLGDAAVVGYVGRLVETKGVVTLIDAMKTVWRVDPAVRLLLAGSGLSTNPADPVVRAVAGLTSAERARLTLIDGFLEADKSSIFGALDVFAMPSVAESFGIAYLEAWSCQKAVIGSRIGATQCVVEDGVDGLLVASRSPEELSRAILRLLADRPMRERMGQAGFTKTMSRYTWDRITDQLEHIYGQLRGAGRTQTKVTPKAGSSGELARGADDAG